MEILRILAYDISQHFAEITLSVINVFLLFGNIYWQNTFKKLSTKNQSFQMLLQDSQAKDEIIKGLTNEKHQYKLQYHNLLEKHQQLESEMKAYKHINKIANQ